MSFALMVSHLRFFDFRLDNYIVIIGCRVTYTALNVTRLCVMSARERNSNQTTTLLHVGNAKTFENLSDHVSKLFPLLSTHNGRT